MNSDHKIRYFEVEIVDMWANGEWAPQHFFGFVNHEKKWVDKNDKHWYENEKSIAESEHAWVVGFQLPKADKKQYPLGVFHKSESNYRELGASSLVGEKYTKWRIGDVVCVYHHLPENADDTDRIYFGLNGDWNLSQVTHWKIKFKNMPRQTK